jgi:GntR family transcriptional regulator/MocR family aminotransferase
MEDPGFRGTSVVFQNHNLHLDYIPLESGGILIDSLYASNASVVYVTPSHQFPMGMVMPIQKRNQLLKWALDRQGIIIEDDYDSEFRYQSDPIPALKALDYYDRVIYLGTLSKIFLPSARLSYMVLPRPLVQDFQRKIQFYNQSVSPLIQHATQIFMRDGHFEKHVRRMRRIYRTKYEMLLASIQRYMGSKVRIVGQKAGLHLLLKVDIEDYLGLAEKAKNQGINVEPVTDHWSGTGHSPDNYFIIGFGGLKIEEIDEGIRRLAQVWFERDYT